MAVPITCLTTSYNEAQRIEAMILAALPWADEIVLIDKSSTDGTPEIAKRLSPKVRVISRPYSPKGDDDFLAYIEYPKHDWIFILTCSEIPTRKVIEEAQRLLNNQEDAVDVIYVPRRMFSLGINQPGSPWYVCHYPFLFHRRRAIVQNLVHDNIHPRDPKRSARIPYQENCCVYHFTHPTVREMMLSFVTYAELESTKPSNLSPHKAIRSSLKNIQRAMLSIGKINGDWIPALCGWAIYWLMTALYQWEKHKGYDVPSLYAQWRTNLLKNEWQDPKPTPPGIHPPQSPFRLKAWQRALVAAIQLPYYLGKWLQAKSPQKE